MSYANGRLPASALRTIPGTTRVIRADLLAQTIALREAFHRRFNKPLVITSAYRPYSTQESLFRTRFTTNYSASAKIDARKWNGSTWWRAYQPGTNPRKPWASAATPGTSVHGRGRAIDFGSNVNNGGSTEHRWMVVNAPSYGWIWPTLYRSAPYYEPWHFEATPVSTWPGQSMTHERVDIMTELDLNQRIPLAKGGRVSTALNGLTSISVGGATTYSAGGGWQSMIRLPRIDQGVTALLAEVTGLVSAFAALSGGKEYTPQELANAVHEAARAGVQEGTEELAEDIASETVEAVRVFLSENPNVDSDEIASAVVSLIAAALSGQ